MAVNKNTAGLKTSVNVSGQPTRESLTNGSSARKYTAKDVVQNNDIQDQNLRSNSEAIVDHAVGLKATAVVVSKAAEVGLAQLQSIRQQIQNVGPSDDQSVTNTLIPAFDDHDLRVQQSVFANDIRLAIGDSTAQSRLSKQTQDIVQSSADNFFPTSLKGNAKSVNTAAPGIDFISVEMHTFKGVLDLFYSTIQFTVPVSAVRNGSLKAIRIFRATVDNPDFFQRQPVRLSVNAVDRLCARPLRTRVKNEDYLGQYELQLIGMGIDNALSALNPTDPLRNLRTQSSDEGTTGIEQKSATDSSNSEVNDADLAPFIDPKNFKSLDKSVANNLNALRNIQQQNPHLSPNNEPQTIQVGKSVILENSDRLGKQQLRNNRTNFSQETKNNFVVNKTNNVEFKEIAFISPDKLTGKVIGDQIVYTYQDYSVNYAKSYRYYVVTVDNNLIESVRSQIVQVNVDGLRIPQAPTKANGYILGNAIVVNMSVDDLLVEKFEIYRKELTGTPNTGTKKITVFNGVRGYHVSTDIRPALPNGFTQVGESINRANVGGVFYDRDTKQGHKYVYRIFSVDIFGNKSESPKEFQIFWPETTKHVDLSTPSLLAELDTFTGRVKLTFQCEDTRVTRLFLTRRDTGLGQSAFVPPGQIEHIKLGVADQFRGGSKFDDIRLGYDTNKNKLWNGIFENNGQEIVFDDQAVVSEHTYQYRLYGMDRFGNVTPSAISPSLFVANVASVYEPQNLRAVTLSSGSHVSGIQLSWQDGNIDISAEDRVGNQEQLLETSVRTLYQVSRRHVGENVWYDFPMTSKTTLFDPAAVSLISTPREFAPKMSSLGGYAEQVYLRQVGAQQSASIPGTLVPDPQSPPQIMQNESYLYRVQAFQSGGFVSNFSNSIVVNASVRVLAPINFTIKSIDSKARPFYVVLNWDTDVSSGIVDRWEIQRAVVNNIAATKLNNLNSKDFESLQYFPFKTVYSESSRFQARSLSSARSSVTVIQNILTGENHYIDQDVEFGNTYFYRIRSISVSGGQTSEWTYRGVKITDSSYEQKINSVLTPEEKNSLASNLVAMSPISIISPNPSSTSLTLKSISDDGTTSSPPPSSGKKMQLTGRAFLSSLSKGGRS